MAPFLVHLVQLGKVILDVNEHERVVIAFNKKPISNTLVCSC